MKDFGVFWRERNENIDVFMYNHSHFQIHFHEKMQLLVTHHVHNHTTLGNRSKLNIEKSLS